MHAWSLVNHARHTGHPDHARRSVSDQFRLLRLHHGLVMVVALACMFRVSIYSPCALAKRGKRSALGFGKERILDGIWSRRTECHPSPAGGFLGFVTALRSRPVAYSRASKTFMLPGRTDMVSAGRTPIDRLTETACYSRNPHFGEI